MIVAFEGLDQSGKETQARQLKARLETDNSRTVRALSFPDYDTPIGQEIRRALAGEREFSPEVMQLLYVANRFEYKSRIEQWLASGDWIVCDRYRASSVAYGESQGLDASWLDDIQRDLPAASVTVLLDITPETAVDRKRTGRDRYERDLGLLARVRASYLRQAQIRADWVVIDAQQSKEAVAAAVAAAVWPRLGLPSAP
ncbi:MAG: dTMP kinase [Vicinamibacterales bacterium]